MAYLLNLVYVLLVVAVSPWLLWQAIRKGKYRAGHGAKLLGLVPARTGDRYCVWLHAVSVGEVNLLRTLVERIEAAHPDWECVISTTTRTGYELATKRFAHLSVFYCPLDFSWAVRRALARVRPHLLVLAELELWPNLISAAKERGSRVVVVNGRLSPRSHRGYRRLRLVFAQWFRQIDLVAVQNEEYAARFLDLGISRERLHVTGSLKFDGAETDRNNRTTARLRRLAQLPDGAPVFLAGSTQEPEESLAVDAWQQASRRVPELRLILVPRHPERFDHVARMLLSRGVPFRRRTELERYPLDDAHRVLLVDAVGELGAWWGTAQAAFVGGSLTTRRGGQNMIEPAAYGAAICFGPHTHNFRDVVAALLAARGAVVVHDGAELAAFVERALIDQPFAQKLGAAAQALVRSQLGATDRTVELLAALGDASIQTARRAA